MKKALFIIALVFCTLSLSAQADRKDVRSGNRKFRRGNFGESEISYRKGVLKDSTSFAAQYDLASSLYRQERYDEAEKSLKAIEKAAPLNRDAASYYYNLGDVALQKQDYAAAVAAFREALLREPYDMDAKENYTYAKLMLRNQGGEGGGGDNDQDQDQNQNQQEQNQDQDRQNQEQQDQQQKPEQQQPEISPQQAEMMLQAIQAKEKETQDKVNKEKAAVLNSKQKEKNW